jgi:hypothetical protein
LRPSGFALEAADMYNQQFFTAHTQEQNHKSEATIDTESTQNQTETGLGLLF